MKILGKDPFWNIVKIVFITVIIIIFLAFILIIVFGSLFFLNLFQSFQFSPENQENILNLAIENNDVSYCKKLVHSFDDILGGTHYPRDECVKEFAVKTLNTKLCLEQYRPNCLLRISKGKLDAKICFLLDVGYWQDRCFSELGNDIAEAGIDVSFCRGNTECTDRYYRHMALLDQNTSSCEMIKDLEREGECIFSIIWRSGDISECQGIKSCEQAWYFERGVKQTNISLCEKIIDNEKKNKCYLQALYYFAIQEENVSKCDLIENESVLNKCYTMAYEGMAGKKKDATICCNLAKEDRNDCFYYAEVSGEGVC